MVVHDGNIVYNTLNNYMKDKKMSNTEVAVKTNLALKEPPMFKVVYVNDNKTSFEFVISSLCEHFSYVSDTAERIANLIHTEGAATAAVLPYEVAEQKGIEITMNARQQGYPLQIRIEKDNED